MLAEPFEPARDVGPEGVFVVADDRPTQRETPGLRRGVGKPEALEGNGHPDDEPVRRQPSVRAPEGVEAVVVGLTFGHDPIKLDAERVDAEQVGAAAIVERVEKDADDIVTEDPFAPGHAGANFVGLILAHKDHVQVLVVVGEVRRRLLADWNAIARLALTKTRDACLGLSRRPLQEVFQRRRPGHPWDLQRGRLRLRDALQYPQHRNSNKNDTSPRKSSHGRLCRAWPPTWRVRAARAGSQPVEAGFSRPLVRLKADPTSVVKPVPESQGASRPSRRLCPSYDQPSEHAYQLYCFGEACPGYQFLTRTSMGSPFNAPANSSRLDPR